MLTRSLLCVARLVCPRAFGAGQFRRVIYSTQQRASVKHQPETDDKRHHQGHAQREWANIDHGSH